MKSIFEERPHNKGLLVIRLSGRRRLALPGAVVVLIALVSLSCGAKGKADSEERPQGGANQEPGTRPQPEAELRFDPLSLDRDRSIITDIYRDSLPARAVGDSALPVDPAPAADSGVVTDSSAVEAYDTYRIQLLNTRVFTEASLEKEVAQEIFDYTATLDYEVPYFKVRIGDFPERKTAITYLREFVKPAGYPDSWVTRVRVSPGAVLVSDSALSAYYDSLRNEIFYGETLGVWVDTLDDTLDDTPGDSLDDD